MQFESGLFRVWLSFLAKKRAPSRCGVSATVMKNWEPFVSGPLFAIESRNLRYGILFYVLSFFETCEVAFSKTLVIGIACVIMYHFRAFFNGHGWHARPRARRGLGRVDAAKQPRTAPSDSEGSKLVGQARASPQSADSCASGTGARVVKPCVFHSLPCVIHVITIGANRCSVLLFWGLVLSE